MNTLATAAALVAILTTAVIYGTDPLDVQAAHLPPDSRVGRSVSTSGSRCHDTMWPASIDSRRAA